MVPSLEGEAFALKESGDGNVESGITSASLECADPGRGPSSPARTWPVCSLRMRVFRAHLSWPHV